MAEAAHWQRGLQGHRKALERQECDFDITLASTFLCIVLAFSVDDNLPTEAYKGADEDQFRNAVSPLNATTGFRALRPLFGMSSHEPSLLCGPHSDLTCLLASCLATSVWKDVLEGSDDDRRTFSDSSLPGVAGLPQAFVDLCELDENSTNDNNDYHLVLRLITPILCLKPNLENFSTLMAFCGRTWPRLQMLVERKDARSLLLLSYWFAMTKQIDQWWIVKRAETECAAIVHYLSKLNDPKISALLAYPASFGDVDLSYIWQPLDIDNVSFVASELSSDKYLIQSPPSLPGFSMVLSSHR